MPKIIARCLILILALTCLSAVSQPPPALAGKPQTTCPVMGGNINKDLYVDYQGKRVYFCCSACLAPFKQDPQKYIKMLEDAGVTLEPAPGASPPPAPAKK